MFCIYLHIFSAIYPLKILILGGIFFMYKILKTNYQIHKKKEVGNMWKWLMDVLGYWGGF